MPNAIRPDDPHSPQILGINRVLWRGVFLYVKEARKPETIERYGHGTPDDWLERNVYSRFQVVGLTLMGAADVVLFGLVPGVLILVTQIVWIPFWAAGVINGIGHYWGYRNWSTPDASTNIVPLALFIGGEELHNNHHAYPTSAKLSMKWYEFDIGWLYIRLLEAARLAKVKHTAPIPHLAAAKDCCRPADAGGDHRLSLRGIGPIRPVLAARLSRGACQAASPRAARGARLADRRALAGPR